eukprot:1413214-Prorocentrum_lima.AAC.1
MQGVMNSFSGRSQTFTPSDDQNIKFVDGKPVLDPQKGKEDGALLNDKRGDGHLPGTSSHPSNLDGESN